MGGWGHTDVAALRGLAVLALGLAAVAFLGAAAFLVVVALAAGFLAVAFFVVVALVVVAFYRRVSQGQWNGKHGSIGASTRTLAAGLAALGAGSFLASFTVPDGPELVEELALRFRFHGRNQVSTTEHGLLELGEVDTYPWAGRTLPCRHQP
jgi:hypothetical protein